MNQIIKIWYEPQETGPAELLGNRLARIIDIPLLTDELFLDDIVLLDRDADDTDDDYPWIEKVVYTRHPERTYLSVEDVKEYFTLRSVFALLGAECYPILLPREDRRGEIIVGHDPHIDPVALAEAIGIKQPDEDEPTCDCSGPSE